MFGGKILIVEDDAAWMELLSVWLRRAGYHNLHFAKTGGDALELARKTQPDCILLDLRLPDMDGIEVCQLIRAMPSLGTTPIIMVTAHPKDKITGLEYGADYFVQKGENPAEILVTLRAVFRRRELNLKIIQKDDVAVNLESREVYFRKLPVATLSPKTFELFYLLFERGPTPVRKELLYRILEGASPTAISRALDALLNRLRKKLPKMVEQRIKAVKGFGYVYLNPTIDEEPPPSERKRKGKRARKKSL